MKKFSVFFIPLFISLIAIITYINILPNKLFFDDEELIYKNAYVQDLRFLPKYFTTNMIAGAGKVSNMYRPILITSFAIDHLIWGDKAFGFHLTSILLHTANGILIFFLIRKLFKSKLLAFLSAVFFTVHPIQSETVIYASGRTDPLAAFFSLLTITSFLSILESKKFKKAKYLFSIFFFVLALLSKETATVLPLVLFLVYFVSSKKINLPRPIVLVFPFIILSVFYICLRLTVLNFANTLNFYSSANTYSSHLFVRLFTFTYAFSQYLGMLFFPKDLIFARDFVIITSFINRWVILFIFFAIIFTIFSTLSWRKNKLILFSFAWFMITILPVSGIIPINNIIAEHYLYLPSVAFFLIISYFFTQILDKYSTVWGKPIFIVIIIFLISLLSLRTIIRAFDWRDPITFYNISLQQSPWNIPMRNNLGMAYAENGQLDQAVSEYKLAIANNDIFPNIHHNLGNIYKQMGKYEEAEQEYKDALELDPEFFFSYFALSDLYKKTNQVIKLDEINKKIKQLESGQNL